MREHNRVLVVEDEGLVALNIQMMLEHLGYRAKTSASAREAIEVTNEFRPDVVLMDVRLDGEEDGIVTAHRLRDAYSLPVIFVTAYGDDETLQRALETRPYGFLQKPFQERQLQAALQVAIVQHKECAADDALPVPVLPMDNGLLMVPVIGQLTGQRLGLLTEGLRDALVRYAGKALIIDVTGTTGINGRMSALMEALDAAASDAHVILSGLPGQSAEAHGPPQSWKGYVCEDLQEAVGLAQRLLSGVA